MREWNASAVCNRLLPLLNGAGRPLTVHSVFLRAVNLKLPGRRGLIGLIAEPGCLTPYSAVVQTDAPFSNAGICAGTAVFAEDRALRFPEAGLSVNLGSAEAVDLRVSTIAPFCRRPAEGAADALTQALRGSGAQNGLAALATGGEGNAYTRLVGKRFPALVSAVSQGDVEAAARAAASIAGCGAGLTPSSDDLLTGYLTALPLLAKKPREETAALVTAMTEAAAARTGDISASFLLQCGEGLSHRTFLALLRAVFESQDAVKPAAERVLAIGATSGADMITGLILALRQYIGGI